MRIFSLTARNSWLLAPFYFFTLVFFNFFDERKKLKKRINKKKKIKGRQNKKANNGY